MKIVSLSLDPLIADPESVPAARARVYGESVDRYHVLVPATESMTHQLSEKVTVESVPGNKVVQFWKLYRRLSALAKAGECDVVSSQDTYFLALLGHIVARRYHLGLEVQVLGVEKLSWWRKRLSLFTLRRASSIRVLSSVLRKRLVEEFGISTERMQMVPIYVDVSSLGFSTDSLEQEKKEAVVLAQSRFKESYSDRCNFVSVSRLVPIKNHRMQLEALKQVAAKHPKVLLHIVGDGPLQSELEAMVADMDLGEHVVFAGAKFGSELNPYFTQTDCFLLTSDSEGWGMVVIEAATAGLPIIMTEVGCAGDVIVDGKSGLVVPPKDITAFAQAMEQLVLDGSRRKTLALGAKEAVALLPDFDTIVQKYVASWRFAAEHRC